MQGLTQISQCTTNRDSLLKGRHKQFIGDIYCRKKSIFWEKIILLDFGRNSNFQFLFGISRNNLGEWMEEKG